MSNQQVTCLYGTPRGKHSLLRRKISFWKVWKHLRGEGTLGLGGITVSGGCEGIHGQSCLAPTRSTVSEAKPSSG